MTEALLHYVWKFRLYNSAHLQTLSGEDIEVLNTGYHNHNGGPDFLNAKIRIGNKTWAGHIELHINGVGWYQHKHQTDDAYNNVILHVVYNTKDAFVNANNGAQIPCATLAGRIDENLLSRYDKLMQAEFAIACEPQLKDVDELTIASAISRMATERLQYKVDNILALVNSNKGDWEHTAWQLVAKYIGGGVNREAMQLAVSRIPINALFKSADNPLQIEAMLFGAAGLLRGEFTNDYPLTLQKEFNYLKRLYSIEPLENGVFRWAKMRPANFPSVRLAQVAALIATDVKLFAKVLSIKTVAEVNMLFDVAPNIYWKTHYSFDEPSDRGVGKVGTAAKSILLINAIAPLLFAYGKYKGEEQFCERALQFLQHIKAEENNITKVFTACGILPQSAFDTQALIQLKEHYCNKYKCLDCTIGNKLLRR